MAFNINDFRSSFKDVGEPASTATYEVRVHRPPININGNILPNATERSLAYRCQSCSLPGKTFGTSDRVTYGPIRKIVNSVVYQDVVFSFIVSESMNEKIFFNTWHNLIIDNFEKSAGYKHDVEYYDNYVGDLVITQYSKNGIPKYSVKLEDAYPISIEEIPLGWEMNNDYIKVNITIAYRYWTHHSDLEYNPSFDANHKDDVKPADKYEVNNTKPETKQTVPFKSSPKQVASTMGNRGLNNYDIAPDFTPHKIHRPITKITPIKGNGGKFGGGGASGGF
jgi:hypothetical protein